MKYSTFAVTCLDLLLGDGLCNKSMGLGTYSYTFKSVIFESVKVKKLKKCLGFRMMKKNHLVEDLKMTLLKV